MLVYALNNYFESVAFFKNVFNRVDTLAVRKVANLRDVKQPVGSGNNVHKRAEAGNFNDDAVIIFAGRGHMRICDLIDHLRSLFCRVSACGSNVYGTVVLNRDFSAGIFLNLVDNLALRSDYFADLVNRDGHCQNARSIRTHFCRLVNAFFDNFENRRASLMSLLQCAGKNVCRNAVKLRVKLQSSNKFRSSRNLKVHIAKGVFRAENIGKRLVCRNAVNVSGNKSHCNSGNGSLNRNACREQRQSRSADRSHGSRTVRTDSFGNLANRIRELFAAGKNGNQSAFCKSSVTDFAALGRSHASGFAGRIRRHFVIMHVTFAVRTAQRVNELLHLKHVQSSNSQNLGFSALEQSRTVHAGNNVGFRRKRANIFQTATVNAVILRKDSAADNLTLQFLESIADLLFFLIVFHIGKLAGKSFLNALFDFADTILTRQFFGNRKSLVEIFMSNFVNARIKFIGIFGEKLEFSCFLGCRFFQTNLSLANRSYKRL